MRMFEKENFRNRFLDYFEEFKKVVTTDDNEWVVKGFIDIYKNIYTISLDTKVISKIIELMLFPTVLKFASEYNYKVLPTKYQNYYPDMTFITENNEKLLLI